MPPRHADEGIRVVCGFGDPDIDPCVELEVGGESVSEPHIHRAHPRGAAFCADLGKEFYIGGESLREVVPRVMVLTNPA